MVDECRKRFVAWRQGCVAQFVKIFVPAGGMPRMFNSVERGRVVTGFRANRRLLVGRRRYWLGGRSGKGRKDEGPVSDLLRDSNPAIIAESIPNPSDYCAVRLRR